MTLTETKSTKELLQLVSQVEKSLERERGVVQALAERGKEALTKGQAAQQAAEAAEEASRLLAQFADARQAQVVAQIEAIVSEGLTQVFGEPVELKIEQVTRARRVEMDVKVKTGSLETSILDARGGGLAAVAGLLLRITILLLTKDARRFIAADEPLAMLSEEYQEPIAQFLAQLCKSTGLQLMVVTHNDSFAEAADRVIRLEKSGPNTSKVVVVR